jgi:hypothetical protein
MHLQQMGDFSCGMSFQAQQNTLNAEHHTWFLILLGLASESQQLGDGGPTSAGKCWVHTTHHCSIYWECRIIYARLYSKQGRDINSEKQRDPGLLQQNSIYDNVSAALDDQHFVTAQRHPAQCFLFKLLGIPTRQPGSHRLL